MAAKVKAVASPVSAEQVLYAAKGRCQCAGQCGFTHAWNGEVHAQPCGAPHACVIVRKIDYPSFWQLADTEGLALAYPEHYAVDKPILAELRPVTLPGGTVIAACQRCKLLIERVPEKPPGG
jgi:hypothetical protein